MQEKDWLARRKHVEGRGEDAGEGFKHQWYTAEVVSVQQARQVAKLRWDELVDEGGERIVEEVSISLIRPLPPCLDWRAPPGGAQA